MEVRNYPFNEAVELRPDPTALELQEREPVSQVRLPYGGDAWLVTRHADVKTVLGDPRFSRAATLELGADLPRTFPLHRADANILTMDPPDHTRLRKLVAKGFTARRTELLRARAQEIVDDLLDAMEEQGPPADVVEALALPLPITIICEMLGVPVADRDRFRAWSDAAMSITAFTPEEVLAAAQSLREYIAGLVEDKRANPGDDVLTDLVTAHDGGGSLTATEVVTFGVTLLAAGHETTANQIANFTHTLLANPDKMAELRADPALVPKAVEELLRFTPLGGSAGFPRIATEDVELSGVTVPKGAAVFVDIPSGNRDPEVFERPHELDFHRSANPHVAFGHGVHHCVGAQLARVELQVAVGTLLARFPGLEPAGEAVFKRGRLVRGPQSLPVRW